MSGLCYVFGNVLELVKFVTWLDFGGQEGTWCTFLVYCFSLNVPPFSPYLPLVELYWTPWDHPSLYFSSLTLLAEGWHGLFFYSMDDPCMHTPLTTKLRKLRLFSYHRGSSTACFTCLQIIPPDLAFLRCSLVLRSPMKATWIEMYWPPQAAFLLMQKVKRLH